MPRRQCAKCPWKTSTDPYDIPDGYSVEKHRGLVGTTNQGVEALLSNKLRMMACHETGKGTELPCVGWLHNQIGPGNNLPLRLAAVQGRIDMNFILDGEQHDCIEDTIPESQ